MCRASLLITCRSSTSNKVAGSPPNDASVGALLDDKRNKRGRQVWELLRGAYHSGRLPRFGCGNSTCGGPALHYGLFVALRQEILTSEAPQPRPCLHCVLDSTEQKGQHISSIRVNLVNSMSTVIH